MPQKSQNVENFGLALGFVGVAIFAATLPLTRLAVPALGPQFLTAARALIAGLLAIPFLAYGGRSIPYPQIPRLALAALCLVLGFPLFSGLAMRSLPGAHAGVIVGVLPLATAAAAAFISGERPSLAFWACAGFGAALVTGFALHHGGAQLQAGDALLLAAVGAAAVGYTVSAQLSREISPFDVISWVVVLALPLSAPLSYAWRPADFGAVPAYAWGCLAYLGAMSMYLGFFAWNAGLAIGGVARVSQVQLLQVFMTIGLSTLLLGEAIDAETLACASLVVGLVLLGRRLRAGAAPLTAKPSAA